MELATPQRGWCDPAFSVPRRSEMQPSAQSQGGHVFRRASQTRRRARARSPPPRPHPRLARNHRSLIPGASSALHGPLSHLPLPSRCVPPLLRTWLPSGGQRAVGKFCNVIRAPRFFSPCFSLPAACGTHKAPLTRAAIGFSVPDSARPIRTLAAPFAAHVCPRRSYSSSCRHLCGELRPSAAFCGLPLGGLRGAGRGPQLLMPMPWMQAAAAAPAAPQAPRGRAAQAAYPVAGNATGGRPFAPDFLQLSPSLLGRPSCSTMPLMI